MPEKIELISETGIPLLLPSGTRYDCISCGQCCATGWAVTVDPQTHDKLVNTDFYRKYIETAPDGKFFSIHEDTGEYMIHNPSGRCSMLKDNLCLIHSQLDHTYKPYGCRRFPFYFYPTPEGIYVGLAFTCISVVMNVGKPVEAHLPNINNLLREKPVTIEDNRDSMQVKIYDNLITDWDGYKVIEDFLYLYIEKAKGDTEFGKSMWEAMMAIFALVKSCIEKRKQQINAEEIFSFLSVPHEFPISRDAEYLKKEFDYSKHLISWFETYNHKHTENVFDSLIQNKIFTSKIFGKSFSLDRIRSFMEENPARWKRHEMLTYLSHTIWRKDLLTRSNLLLGTVLINLMYPFYNWYFYFSALSRDAAHPEMADAKFSISVLEKNIKHDYLKRPEMMAKRFCESLNILK
jgi:Fe-S-cluster containining protein